MKEATEIRGLLNYCIFCFSQNLYNGGNPKDVELAINDLIRDLEFNIPILHEYRDMVNKKLKVESK